MVSPGVIVLIFTAAIVAIKICRPWIYDMLIVRLTEGMYREVLQRLDPGSTLLDVGVGTGTALMRNKQLILEKDIAIIGVDCDKDYVEKCRDNIREFGMEKQVRVFHESIYDFNRALDLRFDAVYFSSSLMILPDPVEALTHCNSMLKDSRNGLIYSTQTFEENRNVILEVVKPLLKWITTIDFGSVTYLDAFMKTVKAAGMVAVENKVLGTNSHFSTRSYRLIAMKAGVDKKGKNRK